MFSMAVTQTTIWHAKEAEYLGKGSIRDLCTIPVQ